jgi:predicted small metal-binding protein
MSRNLDRKLPLVVCECGFKILIVPDLEEMVRSIKAHATTHERSQSDTEEARAEYSRIEEFLTQKVLISVGKRKS